MRSRCGCSDLRVNLGATARDERSGVKYVDDIDNIYWFRFPAMITGTKAEYCQY